MKTFNGFMSEIMVGNRVVRGVTRKHQTPKKRLQLKKLKKKKLAFNIQKTAQGIAKQKIIGGKKVMRDPKEIQKATKNKRLRAGKTVVRKGGMKKRKARKL